MAPPLTRAAVVAAARGAIVSRGVDDLSLRGVARDLGVTAPALYAYVADKHDLVAAVAADHFDELVRRFQGVTATDPLDRIRALSRAYIDHALAEPALFRLLFRFPPRVAPVAVAVDGFDPATRAFELAAAATEAAVANGQLRVPDPLLASLAMWSAVHGVADVLLLGFGFDEATRERLIDDVIETMLRGQAEIPEAPE